MEIVFSFKDQLAMTRAIDQIVYNDDKDYEQPVINISHLLHIWAKDSLNNYPPMAMNEAKEEDHEEDPISSIHDQTPCPTADEDFFNLKMRIIIETDCTNNFEEN